MGLTANCKRRATCQPYFFLSFTFYRCHVVQQNNFVSFFFFNSCFLHHFFHSLATRPVRWALVSFTHFRPNAHQIIIIITFGSVDCVQQYVPVDDTHHLYLPRILSLFFSLLFRRSYFANSNLTIIRPQRLAVASARVCLFARNILRVSILDYIIMYKHRLMEHNLAANNLVRAYSFIECQFIGAEKKEEREKKKTRQTTTTAARCR